MFYDFPKYMDVIYVFNMRISALALALDSDLIKIPMGDLLGRGIHYESLSTLLS